MKTFTITFNAGVPVFGEYVSDTMVHWLTAGADDFLNYVEFPCRFDFANNGFYMEIKNREEYDKVIEAFTDEQFMKNFKV